MGKECESRTEYARSMRERKKVLGLTVKQISVRAKVAHGTVCKVMQGDDGVLLRHIKAVADALDLTVRIDAIFVWENTVGA